MSNDYLEMAKTRVDNNDELAEYTDELIYDWNEEDHWEWVATAPVAELIEWAQSIREGAEQE